MTKHYIDNQKLYSEMKKFITQCQYAKLNNQPRPKVPEYIGTAIFTIANRLASKSNFANYTYRDDMVSDGIETCIRYIDRFDPEKSDKPFSYFTQIIYFAFLQRIQKEKKHSYIKHKILENSILMNTLVDMGPEENQMIDGSFIDLDTERIADLIGKFETRKVKKSKTTLSDEVDDSDEDGILYNLDEQD